MLIEDTPERFIAIDHEAASRAVVDELVRGRWLESSVDRAGLEAAVRGALRGPPNAPAAPGGPGDAFAGVIGDSPAIRAVVDVARRAAASRASVLITGETGTGKELFARAIHRASPRAQRPFVTVQPSALASTLLESELFGHERGAFTGAHQQRRGRFEQADGGTLFLDEIAEINASTQVKLLRVLSEHTFERVGGNASVHVDVRVMAATNRDLAQEIADGRFRLDLMYRLKVVHIELPPLRARGDDVLLLAERLLSAHAAENGKQVRSLSEAAKRRLLTHAWPGNVRELENAIERAVVLCEGPVLDAEHLPLPAGPAAPRTSLQKLAALEREAIIAALEACNWSTARAAESLGVSVRTIQYRVGDYGLTERVREHARLRKERG